MKRFLAVMLAGAMILAMAGCSGETGSGSSPAGSSDASGVSDAADSSSDSGVSDASTSDTSEEQTPDSSSNSGTSGEAAAQLENAMKPDLISAALQSALGLDEAAATAAAEQMLPLLMYTQGNSVRVAKVIRKLQAGEEVTVAYLGGSITQGSGADGETCYAALTTKWLKEQFPDAKINYVNAGIGATGSYIGVHRCDTQVLSSDPDLVFIDFSVNDTSDRIAINKLTYEGLIRKIWQYDSAPGIICIAMTQEDGTSVQSAHGEVTSKYSIPLISYHDAMLDFLSSNDSVQWSDISGDNIHPNVAGHAILSSMITTYIQYISDNLDSIGETEPELAAPGENGAKYEKAQLLTTDDAQPVSNGAFLKREMTFGGFNNPWIAKSNDSSFTDDDALVIEVEAQNIGILYGKLVSAAGYADIFIDDEFVTTINADFSGGWGSYVEFAELKSFESSGKHTLKIVPKGTEGKASAFYICGITIS